MRILYHIYNDPYISKKLDSREAHNASIIVMYNLRTSSPPDPLPSTPNAPTSTTFFSSFTGNTFTASFALTIAYPAPTHVLLFPVSQNRNACAVSTPLSINHDILSAL